MLKKLMIIKTDDLNDIKIINKYNKYNKIKSDAKHNKTIMSEQEYRELQRKSNDIEHQIIIEHNNKEDEICYISGLKDIKQVTLSFNDINNISKKLISEGINYSVNHLGMETVFINIDNDNHKLSKILEDLDFINIGDVEGKTTYLKEIENGSMRCGNYKKY